MDKVTHFEIPADDKEKAKEFYSSAFGWQINDIPVQMGGGEGSYTTATTVAVDQETMVPTEPGAINGAITERHGRLMAPVITITVDAIEDSLQKITAAGGSVAEERQEIPGMGSYAYVTDPSGNVVGLWENAPR